MKLRKDFSKLEEFVSMIQVMPVLTGYIMAVLSIVFMEARLWEFLVVGGLTIFINALFSWAYLSTEHLYTAHGYTRQEYKWLETYRPYLCEECNTLIEFTQEISHEESGGYYLTVNRSCPFCGYNASEKHPFPETLNLLFQKYDSLTK